MFDPHDKPAYIHTPLLFRVDLQKFSLLPYDTDDAADDATHQQVPLALVQRYTVAETACIKTARTTDLLAVVKAPIR